MTATDASGKAATATPTSTGSYSFPSLALGTYALTFTPAMGYVAPAATSVTLVAGGTTAPAVTVAPVPTTATLSGQITPVGSITTVTATNASGTAATATPTGTGSYAFPNLAFGTYTLSFSPASGYRTPTPISVTVVAGGTTAPTVTATPAPTGPTSASYTLNGTVITPVYISPQTLSGNRFITFENNASQRLTLFLAGLTPTVGTLALNTSTNYAQYNGADFVTYSSNTGSSAQGSLVITAVNTATRVFSGTFSFVGGVVNPNTGSPTTRTVTNGTFSNVSY